MGVHIYIKLKEGVAAEPINDFLEKKNLHLFNIEKYNVEWLDDINNNPKSPQAHLKPKDRDLTMDELKKTFSGWTETELLHFDVGYSRTSQEEIDGYCQMIRDNADNIKYIDGADDILERYDIPDDVKPILEKLNKPPFKPTLLPKDEQRHPDLQSGLFLCKSWGLQSFWVVFGNVEKPSFLKVKEYEEDQYNTIYKDKQGYAYMLLPLLKLDGKEIDQVNAIFEYAWGMGLRENPLLLAPMIYHIGIADFDSVAESYRETYKGIELLEKFTQIFQYITNMYPYSNTVHTGFHYSAVQKKFRVNVANSVLDAQIGVLTAMLRAVLKVYTVKDAAHLLEKLTGEKFYDVELK